MWWIRNAFGLRTPRASAIGCLCFPSANAWGVIQEVWLVLVIEAFLDLATKGKLPKIASLNYNSPTNGIISPAPTANALSRNDVRYILLSHAKIGGDHSIRPIMHVLKLMRQFPSNRVFYTATFLFKLSRQVEPTISCRLSDPKYYRSSKNPLSTLFSITLSAQ